MARCSCGHRFSEFLGYQTGSHMTSFADVFPWGQRLTAICTQTELLKLRGILMRHFPF